MSRRIYAGDFDLVITHDADTYPALEGYTKETYRLNYWFSYTENKDRLLEYYFLRNGKVGSRNLEVFSRVSSGRPGRCGGSRQGLSGSFACCTAR